MVRALIATAILALALIFGGYALEHHSSAAASTQTECKRSHSLEDCTAQEVRKDRGNFENGNRPPSERRSGRGFYYNGEGTIT